MAVAMMDRLTSLHEDRLDHVWGRLRAAGARRVLDLGCGGGALLQRLVADGQFEDIVGLEASPTAIAEARAVLAGYLDQVPARLRLLLGSYAEARDELAGYDAAAMVETIEHVRPEALSRVEDAVFGRMRPGMVYVTTPNREYNPLLGLGRGEFRETDHKFEWDRARFRRWAWGVAQRNGYRVSFSGIGPVDPALGQPTQTAAFVLL